MVPNERGFECSRDRRAWGGDSSMKMANVVQDSSEVLCVALDRIDAVADHECDTRPDTRG